MPIAIDTKNLSRRFGEYLAVDKLNLSINSGEIFGLLGPNAAGKSTTIRLLAGILQPTSGDASILGLDLYTQTEAIKQRIGYVAQQFALYPDLTVSENVMFYGGLYGVRSKSRFRELLKQYDLTQFENKNAGLLSGGYKRRLALACATTHDPELIFLDEPTAGIDPVTRKELWDLFYSLSTKGVTLFVTTHYMEEAERCNRLAFLNHGKLVAQGSPLDIRTSLVDQQVYSTEIPHNPELTQQLMNTPGVQLVNQFGSELRIITDKSVTSEQLVKVVNEFHHERFSLEKVTHSIEDAFISLTSSGEH
ncbi:MAG: ABC transporter ATP-binding protein [Gammaproteobacteria bacterium]